MNAAHAIELSVCLLDPAGSPGTGTEQGELESALTEIGATYEIRRIPYQHGSARNSETKLGYRAAVAQALALSHGDYIVTADPFLAADPYFVLNFWAARNRADLLIASRFAPGGIYRTGFARRVAARWMNRLCRSVLSLPYHDLTSAYRMYRREALAELLQHSSAVGYEFLPESIVHLHGLGRVVEELPYVSWNAPSGRVNVPGATMARSLFANLGRLWRTRNSVFSADYDERAFNSLIWPQRYWQRKRFEIITRMVPSPAGILDIGCGSSKIIQAFPGAVGLDIQLKKLRYLMRRQTRLVRGSAFRLPFADDSFRTVICSEVIEHIPFSSSLFDEFRRVLRPEGILILGTPDYGTWVWPAIEWIYGKIVPGGYAHEHITHYTGQQLIELLVARGFHVEHSRTICGAELIIQARRTTGPIVSLA